jgi:hypothetical protein
MDAPCLHYFVEHQTTNLSIYSNLSSFISNLLPHCRGCHSYSASKMEPIPVYGNKAGFCHVPLLSPKRGVSCDYAYKPNLEINHLCRQEGI